jgi:hypothetical protein
MGQGRDQAKQYLRQNPEAMATLRNQLLSSHGIGKLLLTAEGSAPMTEEEELELSEASKAAAKKDKDKKKSSIAKH